MSHKIEFFFFAYVSMIFSRCIKIFYDPLFGFKTQHNRTKWSNSNLEIFLSIHKYLLFYIFFPLMKLGHCVNDFNSFFLLLSTLWHHECKYWGGFCCCCCCKFNFQCCTLLQFIHIFVVFMKNHFNFIHSIVYLFVVLVHCLHKIYYNNVAKMPLRL